MILVFYVRRWPVVAGAVVSYSILRKLLRPLYIFVHEMNRVALRLRLGLEIR